MVQLPQVLIKGFHWHLLKTVKKMMFESPAIKQPVFSLQCTGLVDGSNSPMKMIEVFVRTHFGLTQTHFHRDTNSKTAILIKRSRQQKANRDF